MFMKDFLELLTLVDEFCVGLSFCLIVLTELVVVKFVLFDVTFVEDYLFVEAVD